MIKDHYFFATSLFSSLIQGSLPILCIKKSSSEKFWKVITFILLSKMSVKVHTSTPIKYPSSWFPSCHGDLWSMWIPSGTRTVLPKSISQILALLLSWTKRRELPINCKTNYCFVKKFNCALKWILGIFQSVQFIVTVCVNTIDI